MDFMGDFIRYKAFSPLEAYNLAEIIQCIYLKKQLAIQRGKQ